MGLIQMVEEHLKPVLFSQPFAGKRVFIVGDPAGRFKSQIDEETPFDVLKTLGFMAYPASTNAVDPRLLAVERLLRQTIMGEPGLQISRAGCPTLIRAMGDRYRYRRRRERAVRRFAGESFTCVVGCVTRRCQVFCLGTQANLTGRVMRRDRPRLEASREPVSATGWEHADPHL